MSLTNAIELTTLILQVRVETEPGSLIRVFQTMGSVEFQAVKNNLKIKYKFCMD